MNCGVGRRTTNRVVQAQLDLSANVGYTEKNAQYRCWTRDEVKRHLELRAVKWTTSTIKTRYAENADRSPMTGDDADVISADGSHVSVSADAYRRVPANSASALRRADVDLRRP